MSEQPTLLDGRVADVDIADRMEQAFLDYSMSVIVGRALPDVRDGLKPVQRHILYAMLEAGLRPDRQHRKCAAVIGDVMKKYHPHGDASIYDALVRLAQDFAMRAPLVDGRGNFGSVDGDPAAAHRYCVVGSTRVRTLVGGTVRIEDLASIPANGTAIIDEKLVGHDGAPVVATRLFDSGVHPVRRLVTREGLELTGTPNHPILCLVPVAGAPVLQWLTLGEIRPGMRVAVHRGVAPASVPDPVSELWASLAGALVSEGWASVDRAGFNNTDPAFFEHVRGLYRMLVGGAVYAGSRRLTSGRLIFELDIHNLASLSSSPLGELIGRRSADKRVPELVWRGDAAVKRAFLQTLFEGDGSCLLAARFTPRIVYSTSSGQLAKEVQRLLLEFGVVARHSLDASRGEHTVGIWNRRDARLFHQRVGFWGAKQERLSQILAQVPLESRAMSSDAIPYLADFLRSEAPRGGREWLSRHNIDRIERWERDGQVILDKLGDPELRSFARRLVEKGYYYATVTAVEDAGRERVYSLRVDDPSHAFISDGFVSHNTECRLTPGAMALLDSIDEDTVDFAPNYDGFEREPVVLPARFPNLLVNGATGIAVGMATSIPPHNLGEVVAACLHLLRQPDATLDELMEYVPAPDFPTGGRIVPGDGIRQAYETGRGAITIEAVAATEMRSGNLPRIVVTEIGYQVNKATLLEKIAELAKQRRIDAIRDLRDESSRDGMRIVIELKRGEDPATTLAQLYDATDLRTNFNVNLVALDGGQPRTMGLREVLVAYLAHQRDVLTRRTTHRRDQAAARAHVLEGLLVALRHLDAVVALIRAADSAEVARGQLMERFGLSEPQARAVLDMQLRRLAALEREAVAAEHADLRDLLAELEGILADPDRLDEVLAEELVALADQLADPRRSRIGDVLPTTDRGGDRAAVVLEAQPVTVYVTASGWVKAVGERPTSAPHPQEGERLAAVVRGRAGDTLLLVDAAGTGFRLELADLEVTTLRRRGIHLSALTGETPDAPLVGAVRLGDSRSVVTVSATGLVKRTAVEEYASRTRSLIAAGTKGGDRIVAVLGCDDDDELLLAHTHGLVIRFAASDVRVMGRTAAGVAGIDVPRGGEVVAASVARDEVVTIAADGAAKRVPLDDYPLQRRGGKGVQTGTGAPVWVGSAADLHVPTVEGWRVVGADSLIRAKRAQRPSPALPAVTGTVVPETVPAGR